MPGRTTIAAASGLVAGIAMTVAGVDGVSDDSVAGLLLQTIAVGFFPTVIVTLVAFTILRRWTTDHETRNRRDIEVLAEQRRLLRDDFDRRSAVLREREEACLAREERLSSLTVISQNQHDTLLDQLADARAGRARAARELHDLRQDFDALADQHNAMVLGEVDERVQAFSRPRRIPRPSAPQDRRRERAQDSTPRGLTRLYVQASEEEQHTRPAEGV